VACGRTREELDRRITAIGWEPGSFPGMGGSPAEVADQLGRYGELGAEVAYLQVLDLQDLDHLELLAGLIDQVG
jgi:hypothetical protein